MTNDDLTSGQQTMVDVWERHMAAEFEAKSIEATMGEGHPICLAL